MSTHERPTTTQTGPDPAEAAAAAARAAGVTVRDLADIGDLQQAVVLLSRIWGRQANPPVTLELLRAFAKAGNHVAGAFDGDRLLGACVGFFHAPLEDALHSHIAGVAPEALGRSVGFALKVHQREWTLARGVTEIAWTFDPLVGRNAWFNISKLAATPAEYLPNFYGAMLDDINGDGDSDRLLVRWSLRAPSVEQACAGSPRVPVVPPDATVALAADAAGAPVPGPADAEVCLVAVPRDVTRLRTGDPGLAADWRTAVRATLTGLFADGARVVGFTRSGSYVLRRTP
ncbi:GNAT family N-acetyltransferase [Phycicoccus sp. CSK15P-2]|uniref:GNAT family N-acetyltransferase n=1 Tax=Phycicoccus sp. CSK15P-2 TaxID=2807627 RepID=UPI0019508D4D|nr:GNAT family N-acetyltransferase [Phycicoccus sp. CSK15P-2]MBM6404543.1 GNAT family N-acetyltransferase [Phycicoccus sp. CSK15P-2]